MASKMFTIDIPDANGKHYPITVPSKDCMISQVQELLEKMSKVSKDEQFLYFRGRLLMSENSLGDYKIVSGAEIEFIRYTPKAICHGFKHPLPSSSFSQIPKSSVNPKLRLVKPGLNFTAKCNEPTCVANGKNVCIAKGFYEDSNGQCHLNTEINRMECPMCGTFVGSDSVEGLAILKCRLDVKVMIKEQDEFSYSIQSSDRIMFSESIKDMHEDYVEYIVLVVKPL